MLNYTKLLHCTNTDSVLNHNLNDTTPEQAIEYLLSYPIKCEITITTLISIIFSDEYVTRQLYTLLNSSVLFRLSDIIIKCLFQYLIDNKIEQFYIVFNIIARNKYVTTTVLKNMFYLDFKDNKYKEIIDNAMILECLTTKNAAK